MEEINLTFVIHVCFVILSAFLCLFNIVISTMNLNRVEDQLQQLTQQISILEADFYGVEEEAHPEPFVGDMPEEQIKED